MILTWHPDFCPNGEHCSLEIEPDWSAVRRMVLCAHHQNLKTTLGLTDDQVFRAILASSRVKETARWTVKEELMRLGEMDKEHPGVAYTVEADGNFTIQSGKTGPSRTALRTAVNLALAVVEQPVGTSTVTVN